MGEIVVRPVRYNDLERIVEIDKKILGKSRRSYWERKFEEMEEKEGNFSFVAEKDGKVVGFIFGGISGWEFGVPNTTGWVDTIGVDPDYQKQGVGRRLFEELVKSMKEVGVRKIFTLVNWEDWDLLKFFKSMNFKRGEMINLSYEIEDC